MKRFNEVLTKINDTVISFIKKYWFIIAMVAVVALAIAIRVPLYTKESDDYYFFLKPWYTEICKDAKAFLSKGEADYTPTYMYFLCIISMFKISPESATFLRTLKTISVVFDFATAALIFCIIKFILKKNNVLTLLGTGLALFLPQIFLNSAFWGQCDAIYTFFVVLSLFFALKNKSLWSAVSFGVAFAFKLQSVFFFPVLLLLWLNKKFKFRCFFIIPVVYIILMIPAMICGKSFISCLTVYFTQAGEYVALSMNAPNVYSFMYYTLVDNPSVTKELVPAATVLGLMLIAALCLMIFLTHKDMSKEDVIKIAFLISLFAPYVLPKMHERYFYIAEVLSILYVVINPKKWYISTLAVAGTFQGYITYLFKTFYFNDDDNNLIVGATCILAALILLSYDVFKGKTIGFNQEKPAEVEQNNA